MCMRISNKHKALDSLVINMGYVFLVFQTVWENKSITEGVIQVDCHFSRFTVFVSTAHC